MYRAHLSIDRSIDRSRASLTKKRETANNGERVSSVDRGWSERVCAWPPTTLWFSAIVAKSVQWSPPFAFLLRNEPRTQRLVATFCREQRAQVTFTHSPTRAPRSSNFQEDSRPSYIVSCYRVTSKSNLTWIIDDKISYEPNNSSTVHETLESIVYLTRDLKKKKERKKKKIDATIQTCNKNRNIYIKYVLTLINVTITQNARLYREREKEREN